MKKRTRISLLIFSLLLTTQISFVAHGASKESCPSQRVFLIEEKSTTLCWADALGAWLSPSCMIGQSTCGAIRLSMSSERKDVDLDTKDLVGGKNPGSTLCTKLGGAVMIATLPSGSGITFCAAKDGSLIDCNALANKFYSPNK